MKRTDNPFEGMGIRYPQAKFGDGSVKQKAFFEHGSYEAGLIPFVDRINILAGFVLDGYDLHKLVDNYLHEKAAWDDDRRKHSIASSFHIYSMTLADNLLTEIEETQQIPDSDTLKRLIRKFYNTGRLKLYKEETATEEMQRRINEFANLAKEIYSEGNNHLLLPQK